MCQVIVDKGIRLAKIAKTHKRILNGHEDSVKSFCEIALLIASGRFPTQKVHRAVDVELASGKKTANVLYREIDSFIRLIAEGKDFLKKVAYIDTTKETKKLWG